MKKNLIGLCCIAMVTIYASAQTPSTGIKASRERGKAAYTVYCLACHQVDGEGVPRLNPPLIQTSYVTGDKKKLIQWVLKGSTENIPIDGKKYSNNMAAQSNLTDLEIADVLTYVRKSFGNNSAPINEKEVKAVRATIK